MAAKEYLKNMGKRGTLSFQVAVSYFFIQVERAS
jgi:hypothetical protein